MPEDLQQIGKITNYYSKIMVAVIELTGPIKIGSTIAIKGATTDFTQTVDSMQIDREPIEIAKSGQAIGLKVTEKVRPGDTVYLIA